MTRFIVLFSVLLLFACKAQDVPADWLGRWTGVEGTYIEIAQGEDGAVTVATQSLDAWTVSHGRMKGDHLEFSRDGKTETLRKGDGAATGMKWLADKKNCLVVKEGEGYCRD